MAKFSKKIRSCDDIRTEVKNIPGHVLALLLLSLILIKESIITISFVFLFFFTGFLSGSLVGFHKNM